MRIEPTSPAGGQPIERQVTVPPGQRVVLTFNLGDGTVTEVVRELD